MVEPPKEMKGVISVPDLLTGSLSRDEFKGKLAGPSLQTGTGIPSNPPAGKTKVENIYWNPETQELVFVTQD
jgi:hypothetical protein